METAEPNGKTRFGAELRAQRGSKGWTQVELGRKIGYSGSFISDVERGDRGPSDDFAIACDRVFELPGTFLRHWDDLQREAFPTWFAPILTVEREATKIEGWELGAVPGLLQTEAYTRELIRARNPQDGEESVERMVHARIQRQEILSRSKPPMLFYVIWEAVLHQCVGGPDVMSAQIDKLIKAAETPGVVIQLLPFSARQHAGATGLLYLYERPEQPVVAYTECIGGARLIEDSQEVSGFATLMALLRAEALSPRDSVALMRTIGRDHERR